MAQANRHAIVIGGSMAGMLAARTLSTHFERVTIVERDCYPARPESRSGVPQAAHVHVLLGRGRKIIEGLFPGILDDMYSLGATTFDSAADFAWLTPAGWAPRFYSGQPVLACSRALMDWVAMSRIKDLKNVKVVELVNARRLVVRDGRVCGVTIQSRFEDHAVETLEADLVVDASGRSSRLPAWLEEFGFEKPPETVVDGGMGYASCVFGRNWSAPLEFRAAYSQAAPPKVNRSGLAFPIEGGRWLVSLSGGGGDYPPTGMEGFEAFAKSLPNPQIHDVITGSTPLGEIRGYRQIPNRLRHYERIRVPEGLAALGDSVCAFNPVYGQGISVAAMGAELLAVCVREGSVAPFQKRFSAEIQDAWALATGEDCRYPGVTADLGFAVRMRQKFMNGVIRASIGDPWVRARLLDVMHMLRKPSYLLHPRVFRGMLGGGKPAVNTWPERVRPGVRARSLQPR